MHIYKYIYMHIYTRQNAFSRWLRPGNRQHAQRFRAEQIVCFYHKEGEAYLDYRADLGIKPVCVCIFRVSRPGTNAISCAFRVSCLQTGALFGITGPNRWEFVFFSVCLVARQVRFWFVSCVAGPYQCVFIRHGARGARRMAPILLYALIHSV